MPLIRLLRALAVLLGLMVCALLAQLTHTAWSDSRRTHAALETTEQLRLALSVMEMASRERGPTNGVLGEKLPHLDASQQRLVQARQRTDMAIAALRARLTPVDVGLIRELDEAAQGLATARASVDELSATALQSRSSVTITVAVNNMVAVVRQLSPLISALATRAQSAYPAIADKLQAARLIAELRETAGLLGSQFTAALAAARPMNKAELEGVQRTRGRIDELRFLIELRMPRAGDHAPATLAWQRAQDRYFKTSLMLAEQVIARSESAEPYGFDTSSFAQAYVPDMNSLLDVRDVLLTMALDDVRAARNRAHVMLGAVLLGVVTTMGLLTTLVVVISRRILRPLVQVARAVNDLADNKAPAPLPQSSAADEMAVVVGAVRSLQERTQQRIALEAERDALIEQLRKRSNTDELTGLLNRRGLFEAGGQLIEQARRHGFEVAVVLLDVDHFKRFNDELGHAAGDAALVAVADVIRHEMRHSDLAGRLGGEEFAVILSHCNAQQGLHLAERVRAALAQLPTQDAPSPSAPRLSIIASFGVAIFPSNGAALDTLLPCADKAMYEAKTAGRNRVVVASAPAT